MEQDAGSSSALDCLQGSDLDRICTEACDDFFGSDKCSVLTDAIDLDALCESVLCDFFDNRSEMGEDGLQTIQEIEELRKQLEAALPPMPVSESLQFLVSKDAQDLVEELCSDEEESVFIPALGRELPPHELKEMMSGITQFANLVLNHEGPRTSFNDLLSNSTRGQEREREKGREEKEEVKEEEETFFETMSQTAAGATLAPKEATMIFQSISQSLGLGFIHPDELDPPLTDLTTVPLLGRGSFGAVYPAVYQGQAVAVKVLQSRKSDAFTRAREPLKTIRAAMREAAMLQWF